MNQFSKLKKANFKEFRLYGQILNNLGALVWYLVLCKFVEE